MKTNLSSLLRPPFVVVSSMLFAAGVAPFASAASFQGLGDLPGGTFASWAYGVSADGKVVIGQGTSASARHAFRWTSESGLVPLGFAPGDDWSIAYAVSADGNTIVGDNANHAVISDPAHQMRLLRHVLTNDYGLNLTGWELTSARGISPDGNTIVGSGINPVGQYEAWIVTRLKPTLTISKTTDTCWLSWPASAADFSLHASDSLVSGWSNVVASVITNGSSVCLTQNLSGSTRFFRLAR